MDGTVCSLIKIDITMKIIRDFGEYFKYSLHDAHINRIEHRQGNAILHFNYIFSYDENVERTHKAQIVFEQTDIDDVRILVFNSRWLDDFQGECIDLETYQSRYENSEFEVIEESYNWGKAVLQGWLWIGDVPVCCIMDICFEGKMIYVIDE